MLSADIRTEALMTRFFLYYNCFNEQDGYYINFYHFFKPSVQFWQLTHEIAPTYSSFIIPILTLKYAKIGVRPKFSGADLEQGIVMYCWWREAQRGKPRVL